MTGVTTPVFLIIRVHLVLLKFYHQWIFLYPLLFLV